jgi:hypothetical protein
MELRIRIKLLIVLNLYQCVQNIVSREFLFHWEHGTYLYPHNKRERKKKDEKKSRKRAEKEQKREKRNEKREMRNEK